MQETSNKTRRLTFLGLMLAITIILDLTPLGAIPVGTVSATINHLPTIITGVILGPIAGLVMGLLLGLVSLVHALTRPVTVLDPLFINPLVSVLPRMFIGVVSHYIFAGMGLLFQKPKWANTIGALAAGVAGSLTNTGLVFLMLYLLYAKDIVAKLGTSFGAVFMTVFTTNAIAEAIIAALITLPVVLTYFRIKANG